MSGKRVIGYFKIKHAFLERYYKKEAVLNFKIPDTSCQNTQII